MFKKIFILFIAIFIFSFTSNLSAQNFNTKFSKRFIHELVTEKNIEKYINPEELKLSKRLGINYKDVKYKFLISYGLSVNVKKIIQNNPKLYDIKCLNLDDDYYELKLLIKNQNYTKSFFFKDTLLITPASYYSRSWERIDSKYFIFVVSDKSLTNSYAVKKLDDFVDSLGIKLKLTGSELELLQKEKIYYFLCRNENEVENLTGYKARGNYILAYDYIISSYNSHYHELCHLLMNYKLHNLNLYTLPFFQEGFAVALGGRGGRTSNVVLNLGAFIKESGLMKVSDLFTFHDFNNVDPSFAYPLSGIYNKFLIEKIGIDNYLKLYEKYSGSFSEIQNIRNK